MFEFAVAASGNERTAPGVNDNAIAVTKGSRDSGIAVAAGDDFCLWPDFGAQTSECVSVFRCDAAGKKHTGPVDVFRQLGKNHAQPLRRLKSQIRWGQFAVIENAEVAAFSFGQSPRGFGSTAFHPEDSFGSVRHRYRLLLL